MKPDFTALTRERQEAWTGDAVLALFVREWILRENGGLDGDMFVRFTSNDFLSQFGKPTAVEAEIGRIYRDHGLEAAFTHMEEVLLPQFIQREKVRAQRIRNGQIKG